MARRSLRSIAGSLRRSPSTISREVRRNGGRQAYPVSPTSLSGLMPNRSCTRSIIRRAANVSAGRIGEDGSTSTITALSKLTR
ncbi:MAG: helix-turn-helix domain-containing protein [Rhodobacteraceae bacterium]|nr:helix-turn-helix domain-containing protein [Paracoccaceae bacterium]